MARNHMLSGDNDFFLFDEIMRVEGTTEADQEFKEFQRKMINGEDTEAVWSWLEKNINWVDKTSEEYIELLKQEKTKEKLRD